MTDVRHFLDDLQASEPEVRLGLSRAGVRRLEGNSHPLRREREAVTAEIDCSVDLDSARRACACRFPEVFEEAIERVVLKAF
jgi:GTP cyclohydrolase FolE2